MMLRIAELMPQEYHGAYEKVTSPEMTFAKLVE